MRAFFVQLPDEFPEEDAHHGAVVVALSQSKVYLPGRAQGCDDTDSWLHQGNRDRVGAALTTPLPTSVF